MAKRIIIENQNFGYVLKHSSDKGTGVCWAYTGQAFANVSRVTLEPEPDGKFAGSSVVGGGFQAYGAGCNAIVFGIATEAWNTASLSPSGHLIGAETSLISQQPELPHIRRRGIDVVFKNRPDSLYGGAMPRGKGANHYNANAHAVVVTAQRRSKSDEYCGWTSAMRLGPHALDRSRARPFSAVIDMTDCPRDASGNIPYRWTWREDGTTYGERYDTRKKRMEIWRDIDKAKPWLVKSW